MTEPPKTYTPGMVGADEDEVLKELEARLKELEARITDLERAVLELRGEEK